MKKLSTNNSSILKDQNGLAAIIVTIILMLVISLITLSFSRIARQEQRQTLDRNLSSRAFYAAESGVNLAAEAITADPNNYINGKTECGPDNSPLSLTDYQLGSGSETEVTCLLIYRTPATIEYQGVGQTSKVFPVYSADNSNISNIFFNWQSTTAPSGGASFTNCPASGQFPVSWPGSNCDAPILRVDIVPTGGATLSRNSLLTNTFSAYIFPGATNQVQTFASNLDGNQGVVFTGVCNSAITADKPYYCQASVTGLNASKYFVRLQSLYGNANTVIAAGPSVSTRIPLIGAQVVIDSTGKSVDVVRRIQVRKPLAQNNGVPDFDIVAAAGLCKRYYIIPDSTTIMSDSGINLRNPSEPCAID